MKGITTYLKDKEITKLRLFTEQKGWHAVCAENGISFQTVKNVIKNKRCRQETYLTIKKLIK